MQFSLFPACPSSQAHYSKPTMEQHMSIFNLSPGSFFIAAIPKHDRTANELLGGGRDILNDSETLRHPDIEEVAIGPLHELLIWPSMPHSRCQLWLELGKPNPKRAAGTPIQQCLNGHHGTILGREAAGGGTPLGKGTFAPAQLLAQNQDFQAHGGDRIRWLPWQTWSSVPSCPVPTGS